MNVTKPVLAGRLRLRSDTLLPERLTVPFEAVGVPCAVTTLLGKVTSAEPRVCVFALLLSFSVTFTVSPAQIVSAPVLAASKPSV